MGENYLSLFQMSDLFIRLFILCPSFLFVPPPLPPPPKIHLVALSKLSFIVMVSYNAYIVSVSHYLKADLGGHLLSI